MKTIKYIISSHYFSIVISLILVISNILFSINISNSIDKKLSSFECKNEIIKESIEKVVDEPLEIIEENNTIFVDIKGEVKNPGVYEIDSNSRVSDIIKLSGGLTKNANTRFINLSKVVKDGDVIVIYSNNEIKNATKEKVKTVYVDTPCICEEVKNDACLVENLNIEDPVIENKIEEKNETIIEENNTIINEKINLNTATIEELMTLDGIGESKAKAIIEYRDSNGGFKSIEEITNIKGIGDSIYVKIKENITI